MLCGDVGEERRGKGEWEGGGMGSEGFEHVGGKKILLVLSRI